MILSVRCQFLRSRKNLGLKANRILIHVSRWRVANRRVPRGQLDDTRKFLPGPDRLAARSVVVPMDMDPDRAVGAAGALPGERIRSFEVWWDSEESKLMFVLVSDAHDMGNYERAFRVMYPNAAFEDMDKTVPKWFDRTSEYQIFDVGTRHGHYATVLDVAGAHGLMTRLANTIQESGRAWLQFVFARYDFAPFLRRHMERMDARLAEIKRGQYVSPSGHLLGHKPRDHPELNRDFMNTYRGLQRHVVAKTQGAHLAMSIRGVVQGDAGVDLPFDEVAALSVEDIGSGYEHLTKFRYDYGRFCSDARRSRVRAPGRDRADQRICMFESRHMPDPEQFLGGALSRYFDKRWWGLLGYRTRRPLPFLILNPRELPLFVHLPDPATPNIDTTRGVHLPSKPSGKAGSDLGFFDALRPDDDDGYTIPPPPREGLP